MKNGFQELLEILKLKGREKHLPNQLSGDSSREYLLEGADERSGSDPGRRTYRESGFPGTVRKLWNC